VQLKARRRCREHVGRASAGERSCGRGNKEPTTLTERQWCMSSTQEERKPHAQSSEYNPHTLSSAVKPAAWKQHVVSHWLLTFCTCAHNSPNEPLSDRFGARRCCACPAASTPSVLFAICALSASPACLFFGVVFAQSVSVVSAFSFLSLWLGLGPSLFSCAGPQLTSSPRTHVSIGTTTGPIRGLLIAPARAWTTYTHSYRPSKYNQPPSAFSPSTRQRTTHTRTDTQQSPLHLRSNRRPLAQLLRLPR